MILFNLGIYNYHPVPCGILLIFFYMAKFFSYIRTEELCRHTGDPFVCLLTVNQVEVQTAISESRHLYLMIVQRYFQQ